MVSSIGIGPRNNNVVLGGEIPLSLSADKMTKNISPPQKRFNFFMRKRRGEGEDPREKVMSLKLKPALAVKVVQS